MTYKLIVLVQVASQSLVRANANEGDGPVLSPQFERNRRIILEKKATSNYDWPGNDG